MRLSERLAALEALKPLRAGQPFSASARRQSPDVIEVIARTIKAGYWDRFIAHPIVAETYALPEPSADQWAVVARIACELMDTEQPDPNDSGLALQEKY